MKIQLSDIVRSELIGLRAEIVEAKNDSLRGLKGVIIDETKNTLVIESDGIAKKVIKSQVIIKILFQGQALEVDGRVLLGRPEDRLKKIRRIK